LDGLLNTSTMRSATCAAVKLKASSSGVVVVVVVA
jgi:hypothetical protein